MNFDPVVDWIRALRELWSAGCLFHDLKIFLRQTTSCKYIKFCSHSFDGCASKFFTDTCFPDASLRRCSARSQADAPKRQSQRWNSAPEICARQFLKMFTSSTPFKESLFKICEFSARNLMCFMKKHVEIAGVDVILCSASSLSRRGWPRVRIELRHPVKRLVLMRSFKGGTLCGRGFYCWAYVFLPDF